MNEVFICHLHLPTGEIGPFLTIYAIQKHHIVYLINNFSLYTVSFTLVCSPFACDFTIFENIPDRKNI